MHSWALNMIDWMFLTCCHVIHCVHALKRESKRMCQNEQLTVITHIYAYYSNVLEVAQWFERLTTDQKVSGLNPLVIYILLRRKVSAK